MNRWPTVVETTIPSNSSNSGICSTWATRPISDPDVLSTGVSVARARYEIGSPSSTMVSFSVVGPTLLSSTADPRLEGIPYRGLGGGCRSWRVGTSGRVDSCFSSPEAHPPTEPWSEPRSVARWSCSHLPEHRDRQVRQTPNRSRVHPYGGTSYRPFRRTCEEVRVDDLGL